MHYVKTYTESDFRPFYYITYVNINYTYYKVVVFFNFAKMLVIIAR